MKWANLEPHERSAQMEQLFIEEKIKYCFPMKGHMKIICEQCKTMMYYPKSNMLVLRRKGKNTKQLRFLASSKESLIQEILKYQ